MEMDTDNGNVEMEGNFINNYNSIGYNGSNSGSSNPDYSYPNHVYQWQPPSQFSQSNSFNQSDIPPNQQLYYPTSQRTNQRCPVNSSEQIFPTNQQLQHPTNQRTNQRRPFNSSEQSFNSVGPSNTHWTSNPNTGDNNMHSIRPPHFPEFVQNAFLPEIPSRERSSGFPSTPMATPGHYTSNGNSNEFLRIQTPVVFGEDQFSEHTNRLSFNVGVLLICLYVKFADHKLKLEVDKRNNARNMCNGFFDDRLTVLLHEDEQKNSRDHSIGVTEVDSSTKRVIYVPLAFLRYVLGRNEEVQPRFFSTCCDGKHPAAGQHGLCRNCQRVKSRLMKKILSLEKSMDDGTFVNTPNKFLHSRFLMLAKVRHYQDREKELQSRISDLETLIQTIYSDVITQSCLELDNYQREEFLKEFLDCDLAKDFVRVILSLCVSGKLTEESFLISFCKNQLENYSIKSKFSRTYPEVIKRFWTLFKFRSSNKTIEFLRKNIILPSDIVSPQFKYGWLSNLEIKSISLLIEKAKSEGKCVSDIFFIANDGTDVRMGMEREHRTQLIVGGEKLLNLNEFAELGKEPTPDFKIGSDMSQFFLVNSNNTIALPLGHFVIPKNTDENEFVVEKTKEISKILRDENICVVGTITDGKFNMESIRKLRTFFKEEFDSIYVHLYDFVHICKNLRNAIFNNHVKPCNSTHNGFSIHEILDLSNRDDEFWKILNQYDIVTTDVQDLDPVKNLFREEVTEYLKKSDSQTLKDAAVYLENIRILYETMDKLFEPNLTESGKLKDISNRLESLKLLKEYFCGTNLHPKTREMIATLCDMMNDLCTSHLNGKTEIVFACLGSNICENFFSIVKSKVSYPSVLEYCRISAFCWWYQQHQNLESSDIGGIVVPNKNTSHYRGNVYKGTVPSLPKRSTQKADEPSANLLKIVKALLYGLKPSRKIGSIRMSLKESPLPLPCPESNCNHCKPYQKDYFFVIHLRMKHRYDKEKAEKALRKVKSEQLKVKVRRLSILRKESCALHKELLTQLQNDHSNETDVRTIESIVKQVDTDNDNAFQELQREHPYPVLEISDNILNRVFFVDLETTSLYGNISNGEPVGITEFGVKHYSQNVVSVLSNPCMYTNDWCEKASKITGIGKIQLRGAIDLLPAVKWFWNYVTSGGTIDPIIVSHNASFEKKHIDFWCDFFGYSTEAFEFVDSLRYVIPAKVRDPETKELVESKRLSLVYQNHVPRGKQQQLNIHRAASDVIMMFQVTESRFPDPNDFILEIENQIEQNEKKSLQKSAKENKEIYCNCHSGCNSNRCKCRKAGKSCGEHCHAVIKPPKGKEHQACANCSSIDTISVQSDKMDLTEEESTSEMIILSDSDEEEEEIDFMSMSEETNTQEDENSKTTNETEFFKREISVFEIESYCAFLQRKFEGVDVKFFGTPSSNEKVIKRLKNRERTQKRSSLRFKPSICALFESHHYTGLCIPWPDRNVEYFNSLKGVNHSMYRSIDKETEVTKLHIPQPSVFNCGVFTAFALTLFVCCNDEKFTKTLGDLIIRYEIPMLVQYILGDFKRKFLKIVSLFSPLGYEPSRFETAFNCSNTRQVNLYLEEFSEDLRKFEKHFTPKRKRVQTVSDDELDDSWLLDDDDEEEIKFELPLKKMCLDDDVDSTPTAHNTDMELFSDFQENNSLMDTSTD